MFQILHQVQSNMKKSSDSSHTTSVCGNDLFRMSGAVAIALLHIVLCSEGRLGIQSSSTHPLQTQAVAAAIAPSCCCTPTVSCQHSTAELQPWQKRSMELPPVLCSCHLHLRTQQEVAAACDAADLQQHVTLLHCLPASHRDKACLRSRRRLRPWRCCHCSL